MRVVLKKHTGVAVHWGKNDTLGDVCNALEVLGEKLDDKDLAEKFGGDRVEFVNRHSWGCDVS